MLIPSILCIALALVLGWFVGREEGVDLAREAKRTEAEAWESAARLAGRVLDGRDENTRLRRRLWCYDNYSRAKAGRREGGERRDL